MKIGSLFSGAGGLDMAVEHVFGGRTVWHCEFDAAASKVLAHRYPGVRNLRDITAVDWSTVEPVDVLCGGFPCQDISSAGRQAGMGAGTRSGLWSEFARAIAELRPPLVVIENVRNLLSVRANRAVESSPNSMGDSGGGAVLRGLGAVLGDLSDLRYDAQWTTIAAASVGAPHKRERVFILAAPADHDRRGRKERAERYREQVEAELQASQRNDAMRCGDGLVALLPTPSVADSEGGHLTRSGARSNELLLPGLVRAYGNGELLPTPNASDGTGGGQHPDKREGHSQQLIDYVLAPERWGKYAAAIARWEAITGPAPSPTEPNRNGNPRLNPAFSEWMMGWPAGWVTNPAIGISRNDQLRIIGNGVVPQQAVAALGWLFAGE